MHPSHDPRSTVYRYLRFIEGEGEGGDGTGSTKVDDKTEGRTGVDGVPQAKVDDIVKGRVAETKRQTEERIAKELGCTVEEAKVVLEAHRKRSDEDKTEAQREKEAAEKARKDADAEKAAAAKERFEGQIERALLRARIDDSKVTRAMRVLDVEPGADADAIKKAVEDLKSDEPGWFGEKEEEGNKLPPAPGSDHRGRPPAKKKPEDAYDRGMQRATAAAGDRGKGLGGYDLPG